MPLMAGLKGRTVRRQVPTVIGGVNFFARKQRNKDHNMSERAAECYSSLSDSAAAVDLLVGLYIVPACDIGQWICLSD